MTTRRNRNSRGLDDATASRRAFRRMLARALRLEPLEARRLLAVYTGPLSNVGGDLRDVYEEYQDHVRSGGTSDDFESSRDGDFRIEGSQVYTELRVSANLDEFQESLSRLGFRVEVADEPWGLVEGMLPLDALEAVAQLPGSESILPWWSGFATDARGSVANEAEQSLAFDQGSALFHLDGTGVSIGVISDSVNAVGGGLADSFASGDLPADVHVLAGSLAGGVDEGRAMLELIHDLVPGATLSFASGVGGDAALASAIRTLAVSGVDIIVDDLNGLTSEPFFQDGAASIAVSEAVQNGIVYFATAGNRGESGYEAPFRSIPGTVDGNAGRFHDFDGLGDLTQSISLQPGVTTFVFQYDQPFGEAAADLDILLLDAAGTTLSGGFEDNTQTRVPREIFTVSNPTGAAIPAQLAIQHVGGEAPTRMKWIGFNDPRVEEHGDVDGAFVNAHNPGHSGHPLAISVAAAPFFDPTVPEPFSSSGPVTRALDPTGNSIPLQVFAKPDLTAHDRTSTSVSGFESFVGTSAAASNAAGLAALLLQAQPASTPQEVRQALADASIDIFATGPDAKTGAGLVHSLTSLLELHEGVLPIRGDREADASDMFTLRLNPQDDSQLDVGLNGDVLGAVPASALTAIEFHGGGGSDTLVVDFGNGLFDIPIHFHGGAGADDQLVVTGDPGGVTASTYRTGPQDATGHSGTLIYENGTTSTIHFTGLEPVEDLVPSATFLIEDTAGADVINIVDGPLSTAFDPITSAQETTYQVNFNGLAEEINFRNKTSVTVDALGGNDQITVDIGAPSTADALATIIVEGGLGDETVNVDRSQIGGAVTALDFLLEDGDNTIVLVTHTLAEGDTITDRVQVFGGPNRDSMTVDDRLNPVDQAWDLSSTELNRTGFGGVTYSGLETLQLWAQDGADARVRVLSTLSGVDTHVRTFAGKDSVRVGAGSNLLSSIAGTLTIDMGGGKDDLELMDNANSAGGTFIVSPTSVVGASPAPINFDDATERLFVESGPGVDRYLVTPSADTSYDLAGDDPPFSTSPGDTLDVDLNGIPGASLDVRGPGRGEISFTGGFRNVSFQEIENVVPVNGTFHLFVTSRADPAPGNQEDDGNPDLFRVTQDTAGTNTQIFVNGSLVYDAPTSDISSLTVAGSPDDDTLVIDGVNGLPVFDGTIPSSQDNQNLPEAPEILFSGDGGSDLLRYDNLASGFNQAYAIGDGDGGGFGVGSSEGEIQTSDGETDQFLYFTGLEPVLTTSSGGGTLTVIGDGNDNTIEVVPSPLVAGGTRVQETAGPYEAFDFAAGAFTVLEIFGNDGGDTIDLIELGADEGTLTRIDLDGRANLGGDDGASDTLRVRSNVRPGDGTGVPTNLLGGDGVDTFQVFDAAGSVDNVSGPVTIDGGGADDNAIIDDSGSAGPSETVTITGTTVAGLTGVGGTGGLVTYNNLNGGTLTVSANAAGHQFNVNSTAPGLASTILNTGDGVDTTLIDDGSGTANGVVSPVDLNAQGGDDTLQINDTADAGSNQFHMNGTLIGGGDFATAVVTGGIFGAGGLVEYDADLETIDVDAGDGPNEFNVDATGVGGTAPTASVTIDNGAGASTFNVQTDALAAMADHAFRGQGGTDTFNAFVGAGNAPSGNSIVFEGGTPGDRNNRDVANVIDQGGARTVTVTFQADAGAVDVDVDGGTVLDFDTVETLNYQGDVTNDDTLTLTGTDGDDDLTVAPLTANSAVAFLDGNPWDGPSDPSPFFEALPGMAGGTTGPDVTLDGLDLNGLTVDGGGTAVGGDGDQLYVYAPNEDDLVDPATTADPFGFDPSVILPGFGSDEAYDRVRVTDSRVAIDNFTQPVGLTPGFFTELLRVGINTGSFVQSDPLVPGLFVNTGFEDAPQNGLADDVVGVLSFQIAMQINGGDPVPAFAPEGDRLQVITPGEINVFSDKNSPPEVTITSTHPVTGQTSFGLTFSSMENVILTPGLTSQTVNLIGDDNDPDIDQPDNYVVVGTDVDSTLESLASLATDPAFNPTGAPVHPDFDVDADGDNEFTLEINGSTPIGFRNVAFLNAFGDDQNPPPGEPSDGNDIDRLEITPYADDTPTGWGIDVKFDEGNPGADAIDAPDLLVVNGVSGVSETTIVAPSAPESGQVRVTNTATGTPIVVIDYTTNTGLELNGNDGSAGDVDQLILRGTEGADTVAADFTARGVVGAPLVSVSDSAGNIYYELFSISGPFTYNPVQFELLGGNDELTLTTGTVRADIDAGPGDDDLDASTSTESVTLRGGLGNDTLNGGSAVDRLEGGAGRDRLIGFLGNDLFFGGDDSDVLVWNNGDGSDVMEGGGGRDRVEVNGASNAPAGDIFEVEATGARVRFERVNLGLFALDIGNVEQLDVNTGGEGDTVTIRDVTATELDAIRVDVGTGEPDRVIVHGRTVADDVHVSGSVETPIEVSGLAYDIHILQVGTGDSVIVDGREGNDQLSTSVGDATLVTLEGGGGDDHLAGNATQRGGSGNDLLRGGSADNRLEGGPGDDTFIGGGGTNVVLGGDGGDTILVAGTPGNDTLVVNQAGNALSVGGSIQATSYTGDAGADINGAGVERVLVEAGDGDDHVIAGTFSSLQLVVNGGPPFASDTLSVTVPAGATVVQGAEPLSGTLQVGGQADVDYTGIEHLNVDARAAGFSLGLVGTNGNDVIAAGPVTGSQGQIRINNGPVIGFNHLLQSQSSLDASQEVQTPPVNSQATGTATLVFNSATNQFDVDLFVQDLVGNLSAAHIHVAPSGSNGPIIFDLDASQFVPDGGGLRRVIQGAEFPAAHVSALLAGLTYFNVHSTSFPAGEIRGQIAPPEQLGNLNALDLHGEAGDDLFSLMAIDGVTIRADGGTPSASDRVVVDASGGADTIGYVPAAHDGGTVTVNGAAPIVLTTVEELFIHGQGGSDTLTVTSSTGAQAVAVDPLSPTSVRVAVDGLLAVDFEAPGTGSAVSLADTEGRSDTVSYTASDLDDLLSVTDTDRVTLTNAAGTHLPIDLPGASTLTLTGLGGNDAFRVNGGNTLTAIRAHGGGTSEGNTLHLTDPSGPVVADLGGASVSGYGGTVSYTGMFEIRADVSGETAQTVAIRGSALDDVLTIVPGNGTGGTAVLNGERPTLIYTGTTTVTANGRAGDDELVVVGDATDENVTVTGTSVTTPGGTVMFNTAATGDVEALSVHTLQGNDTISVTAAAIPIFIDGGDPIGVKPGDRLIVTGASVAGVFPGPENDEGGVQVGGAEPVSFDHIESLDIGPGDGPGVLFATNADDDITIIARDDSTHDGADGDQDFTVAINDGIEVYFQDRASVMVDGLAGDDDFVVRAPAPNRANWNVDVTLVGGPGRDRVHVETPGGSDQATFTPNGFETGTFALAPINSTIVLSNDVLPVFPPLPRPVLGGNGGFEGAEYDATGGTDELTVVGGGSDNAIRLTPGDAPDAGEIQLDNSLPITFENMSGGRVVIDAQGGADTLTYQGAQFADAFQVPDANASAPSIGLNGRVGVSTSGVETYRLQGEGGDDSFTIAPQAGVTILTEGDGPGASDVLNVSRVPSSTADLIVALDATPTGPLVQAVRQAGFGDVFHTGIETVNLEVNDGNLTFEGTRVDDLITFKPFSDDSGEVRADGIESLYRFDEVPAANRLLITGGSAGTGGPIGGGFADKVEVLGTAGSDLVRVDSGNRSVSVNVLDFGFPPSVIASLRAVSLSNGVEVVTVDAGDGNDTFHVSPGGGVDNGRLFVNVRGGSPRATDALVVTNLDTAGNPTPLAATDFVVIGKSRAPDAGNVLVFLSGNRQPGISYENVEVISPNLADADNVLTLGPDLFEENETQANSAFLGSGESINVHNLAIFPNASEHPGIPADQDYFQVVAAATGTLDFQVYFRSFDPALLPQGGDLNIRVLDATGSQVAGTGVFGLQDDDANARVRIPAVEGQSYFLHVVGANDQVINGYDVTVLNSPPPVPYDLELLDTPVGDPPPNNSDTGRSQFDNITRDATPTVLFRLDDATFLQDLPGNPGIDSPPDEVIRIPFQGAALQPGYRIGVFVEGDPTQPGQAPQQLVGYARAHQDASSTVVEGVYEFDFATDALAAPFTLADGSHFISARVQMIDIADQTGFGDRSESLEIVVDTVAPPVSFGIVDPAEQDVDDGLHPESDSGVAGVPATITDRATNDSTPTFYGHAEANAFVRVYLDVNGNGSVDNGDVLLGKTTAIPLDGTNQFPNGQWQLTSTVDLNDPEARNLANVLTPLPFDGLRRILVTAEDVAGNVGGPDDLEIFIDTQGPQITDVGVPGDFDIFDPKPSVNGPTPLIDSLQISVRDLPNRVAPDFLYEALEPGVATTPGHYRLEGDFNGIIPIERVTYTGTEVDGQPATGVITLFFAEPLPDDRYTLTISDDLVDPVGNNLDGEVNAAEPQEDPFFPTGDGQPGGDFEARFTVDSRPELGTWAAGSVWVDTNGNTIFDPDNADFTNRDITYVLGFTSDDIFAGNFGSIEGGADGFDKLAAYGLVGNQWRWLIDTDNDGVPNLEVVDPAAVNGLPVAGRFDNSDANGDEVGAFTGTVWHFDTNHDFRVDFSLPTQQRGFPIVGDFDGDGFDDLGTWTDDTFQIDLAGNARRGWDGQVDHEFRFGFIGVRERPVSADLDQDGFDDLGLWVPDRAGITPKEGGEWYFLVSDGATLLNRIRPDNQLPNTNVIDYTPVPFGPDMFAQFGAEFALPIVGNFDPPVTPGGNEDAGSHTNTKNPLDVNDDGKVTPLDALTVINFLNTTGPSKLEGAATSAPYLDVNGDGFALPVDSLMVINFLNAGGGEAEGESGPVHFTTESNAEERLTPAEGEASLETATGTEALTSGEQTLLSLADAGWKQSALNDLLEEIAEELAAGRDEEELLVDRVFGARVDR